MPPTTQVDALLDAGWSPENICLLTTGHRHPEQVARRPTGSARWATGAASGTATTSSTATSSAARASSGAVVVLCVNETGVRDRARERLYVGMSRATDKLVVVGDPDVVRQVGGDQVAARLGT